MSSTASTADAITRLLPKINRFANAVATIAAQVNGKIGALALTGFGAVAWLAYFLMQSFALSIWITVIAAVILVLPSLLLAWCWWVLDEASAMPTRLAAWMNRTHTYINEVKQRKSTPDDTDKPTRFKDLWSLGSLAAELKFLGDDARDLLAIVQGSLFLCNPLFLGLLTAAAGAVMLINVATIFTALFYYL